jgi:glycosyltransferase involved in cell wall biosynthesis
LPEIVRDGVDGFLTEGCDELVEAINKVKKIDRARCRQGAMERFSAEAIVPQYVQLYRALTGMKPEMSA